MWHYVPTSAKNTFATSDAGEYINTSGLDISNYKKWRILYKKNGIDSLEEDSAIRSMLDRPAWPGFPKQQHKIVVTLYRAKRYFVMLQLLQVFFV